MSPPHPSIMRLAERQLGVVTTAQLLRLGAEPSWIKRQVRHGPWKRLHRGVLVVHSGPVEWRTRAQAALLHAGRGAVLSHRAAGYQHGFADVPPRLVDVSVPHGRHVAGSPGIVVHRRRHLGAEGWAHLVNRLPTTTRPGTVLDLLTLARSDDEVISLLCAAVRARTLPAEIRDAVTQSARMAHRRLVLEILEDVEGGAESALERRYRRDVERRHRLPRSRRQVQHRLGDGRRIRADAVYESLGVRVELDGELAHPGGRTDQDTWRDNAVLLERGEVTLRYRWRHIRVTPCSTAAQVVAALRSRGWRGTPRPCGPDCLVT
ncbi:type IV toxin-antitoxin system AbiEi family antitoxin domain-containing protein [Actinotalea sp. BY-33]|uniref:Type IV toxin-antitoxin system AbiEi family antitoxin domain-containing protein n=1 Tax=Actinotalea soli TaxID=2819234 RepID=A0A939LNJ0_9CELL|nr:type IV toxin-antitoxin system AbiEi family antitoxin domain-containing protein [Actinotalea soli]MBO1751266.1 type IV toxin-antitoxin system AbiEi family antitoxin domain-containing protein [Actinotalea soli]